MGSIKMIFDVSQITGLTSDSRKVKEGFLFVAISGAKLDGRNYIQNAIKNGAKFIAVQKGSEQQDIGLTNWIEVENPHQFLSMTAVAFYKNQPSNIVAVTGTNGKTSTVNFARMIWNLLGIKSASLGTLGLIAEGFDGYAGMTTPDPVTLFSTLDLISKNEFTHLAMEASSHGLEQYRVEGVRVKAAGFTNFTRDHLDYHITMENYFQAKLRLFTEILQDEGVAVLNADIPEFEKISEVCRSRNINVISYGFIKNADISIIDQQAVSNGQDLKLNLFGKIYKVHLNLVGSFQAMNVLCAVGLVLAEQRFSADDVIAVLPKLDSVLGRLQPVPNIQNDIGIYVDFAHTPDGLETILKALRSHTKNRLICIFGCGGDRDRGKRAVMGEISSRLADITIVTDDNPRSEDPQFIRSEIMAGTKNAIEIDGRRNAIRHAVKLLNAGDVLVVAGKGHEQGQIFATHTEPFDDLTEIQTALQNILL